MSTWSVLELVFVLFIAPFLLWHLLWRLGEKLLGHSSGYAAFAGFMASYALVILIGMAIHEVVSRAPWQTTALIMGAIVSVIFGYLFGIRAIRELEDDEKRYY